MGHIYTKKKCSLFVWDSNLTGHSVFVFAKSGNPNSMGYMAAWEEQNELD